MVEKKCTQHCAACDSLFNHVHNRIELGLFFFLTTKNTEIVNSETPFAITTKNRAILRMARRIFSWEKRNVLNDYLIDVAAHQFVECVGVYHVGIERVHGSKVEVVSDAVSTGKLVVQFEDFLIVIRG